MQAIILAAGMGKRLGELTKNNTKCMVKVNGITLIERMLGQLDKQHLSKIVIVVGYEGQKLIDYIATLNVKTQIHFINNPIYNKTNNIYSLWLAKDFLNNDDTLLLESDIIFEDAVLDALLNDPRETLALVDKYESWMDGTCVKLSEDDKIVSFIPGKNFEFKEINEYYKTVNIYKFSKHFSQTHYTPFLEAYCAALGNNEYYEQVLRVITMLDNPEIVAKRLNGQNWYEIDDIQDLDIASSIFAPSTDEKISLMQSRCGGYWRYPKLLDFCYWVNPYFPPQKMIDEIKSDFEKLLTQYPSGQRVNSLLAAKNFDIDICNIAIGNGAAELMNILTNRLDGIYGIVNPIFEEYPNRYEREKLVVYTPQTEDFSYTAQDLIDYFGDKQINSLILINPDNSSGNYLTLGNLITLADWTSKRNIRLVIDESFADFAKEKNNTLLKRDILNKYPHLIVIKSISKSYGVPGLRLGVLASGDNGLVDRIKQDLSIWNINSFAEFYMQIAGKYSNDYKESLVKIRNERKRFTTALNQIEGIHAFPSQANYIMVELTDGITAKELTKKLLIQNNILIKDLSDKLGNKRQLVRIAIKNKSDNNFLLQALNSILTLNT